jgi:hypothetical protein
MATNDATDGGVLSRIFEELAALRAENGRLSDAVSRLEALGSQRGGSAVQ